MNTAGLGFVTPASMAAGFWLPKLATIYSAFIDPNHVGCNKLTESLRL
jgi:hypothetical protein